MRPTERFFEANFYSQVARAWFPQYLTWFTPSRVDEADYGFDTFTDLGGKFFFFQFKHAKTWRTRKKLCPDQTHRYVQAHAKHDQLDTFRALAQNWPPGSFFYVMPGLVDWADYTHAEVANLLDHTYYFDVTDLPHPIGIPTKTDGAPRLSGEHQLNLDPQCPQFTLRSDPIDLPALRFSGLVDQHNDIAGDVSQNPMLESRGSFGELMDTLPSTTTCLLVSPPD